MAHCTLKDVAREAGVSPSLVSKYLAGDPAARMAPDTRRRIDEAVIRMQYRPSPVGRALRIGRSGALGLVIGGFNNPFFALIADRALREAAKKGYQLLIAVYEFRPGAREEAFQSLLARQPDGILITGELPESEWPHAACPCLPLAIADYRPVLVQAVAFFRERGHREFTALCNPFSTWPDCFAGEPGCRIEMVPPSLEERIPLLRELCRRRPTAILTSGWQTATLLLRIIDAEFPGYEPEIIGQTFFDQPVFFDRRMVAVIREDLRERVCRSIARLIAAIEGGEGDFSPPLPEFIPAGMRKEPPLFGIDPEYEVIF